MRGARAIAAAVALWSAGSVGAELPDLVRPSRAWVGISTAELAARYDTVWAVSDVHGHLQELGNLLVAAGLAIRGGPTLAWNPARARALLVVAGDLIDTGPESVEVVLLLERLQREATAAGSRIIVLLGNHEAEFLARPRSATPELMASAARCRSELGLPPSFRPRDLEASAFGSFLRELPVAAFVGTWLFAHAGYLDAGDGEGGLRAFFARLDERLTNRDRTAFTALLESRSIVAYHGWWRGKARRAAMRRRLRELGLNGVLFGHDPDALGARGMAMNREGWLVKLDTGIKEGSRGVLLRCEVPDIASADELAMMRDESPTCRTKGRDGSVGALEVR